MIGANLKRFLLIGATSVVFTILSLSWMSRLHYGSVGIVGLQHEDSPILAASDIQAAINGVPSPNGTISKVLSKSPTAAARAKNIIIKDSKKTVHSTELRTNVDSSKPKATLQVQLRQNASIDKTLSNSLSKDHQNPSFNVKTFNSTQLCELTKDFKINVPDLCKINATHNTYQLLVMVFSAVPNYLARLAIRKTWGGYAMEKGAKLTFLLGGTINETHQERVNKESESFADIIQSDYIDHYYNLTLKTTSMMHWVSTYCSNHGVKFVFKVDDDMFVNMPRLLSVLEHWTEFNRTIFGKVAYNWKPHREIRSKWYIPKSEFPHRVFPNYTTGAAYVFTADAAKDLYNASLNTKFLYREDVFMTGIVAERVGVKRKAHPGFYNWHKFNMDACRSAHIITSHHYSPSSLAALWDKFTQPRNCTRS